jgi:predicted house-cleaning noncanonical NTP pyrophosphatase (MazG superfamily)
MKLPVIKSLVEFIDQNDEDYITETLEVLEHVSQAKGIKDEELEVIGELISNMYGSMEVHKDMKKNGSSQKDALNGFMKRVTGSIDKS